MRITVRHKNTEITLDESGINNSEKYTTMRYDDAKIHETIRIIAEEVKKLSELEISSLIK
jgi:hypothetical protein